MSPADTPKLGAVRAELACRVSPFQPHFSYQTPPSLTEESLPVLHSGRQQHLQTRAQSSAERRGQCPSSVLSLSTVDLASLTGKQGEDSLPHPAFKAASKLSKIISWSLEEERLNR